MRFIKPDLIGASEQPLEIFYSRWISSYWTSDQLALIVPLIAINNTVIFMDSTARSALSKHVYLGTQAENVVGGIREESQFTTLFFASGRIGFYWCIIGKWWTIISRRAYYATWIRAYAYYKFAASHEMTREYFISERISSVIVSFNKHKYPSFCHLVQSDISMTLREVMQRLSRNANVIATCNVECIMDREMTFEHLNSSRV